MHKVNRSDFLVHVLSLILIGALLVIGGIVSGLLIDDFFKTKYPLSSQTNGDFDRAYFATKYESQPSDLIFYIVGIVVVFLILTLFAFLLTRFLWINKGILRKYDKNFASSLILGLMMSLSVSMYFFSQAYIQGALFLVSTISTFLFSVDKKETKRYIFKVSIINGMVFSIAGLLAVIEWFLEIDRGVMGRVCGGSPAAFCSMLQFFQMIVWIVGLFAYFTLVTFIAQWARRFFSLIFRPVNRTEG